MKHKEILKLFFFSIIIASIVKYIDILVINENMEVIKKKFQKNLINLDIYQQKAVEIFYLELVNLFLLPYIVAILFYFFCKIKLKQKNNFLVFILMFTLLFYLSYFLIGYSYKFLK